MFDPEYGFIPDEYMTADPDRVETIPSGLAEMEPGPFLAAILAHTDVSRLSGHDRVLVLRAQQRMASHYSAGVYAAMASITEVIRQEDGYDDDLQGTAESAAAAEIRAALRLTRRATEAEHTFALELHERLPSVAAALASGEIDVRRAKTIVFQTTHLATSTAQTVAAAIVGIAPRLTTGQLAARLKKLCIEANPDEAADRHRRALDERRLVMEPTVEGTANIHGIGMSPDRVAAALNRVNQIARSLRHKGEVRTMDQLRADVFLDLLEGANHATQRGGVRGVLDLHVDIETLAHLTETPGELGGYGPVIADIARQIADDSINSQWRYTVTDSDTGQPLHIGTTRRRHHNTGERRRVETRDQTCIFPGCRMPSVDCDIDHTIAYSDGGATDITNAGPLCRHDHGTKTNHRWTYTRLPNGDYEWTTKLRHTYTTSGAPP